MSEHSFKFDKLAESKFPEGSKLCISNGTLYLFLHAIDIRTYYYYNVHASISITNFCKDEEMALEFTEIFSKYESLIDRLFDEFASKNKTTSSALYRCCRDVGMVFRFICIPLRSRWLRFRSCIRSMCLCICMYTVSTVVIVLIMFVCFFYVANIWKFFFFCISRTELLFSIIAQLKESSQRSSQSMNTSGSLIWRSPGRASIAS